MTKWCGMLFMVGLAACSPKYQSGKTQCSDGKHQCPDGYTCRAQGTSFVCFSTASGNGGAGGSSVKPSGGGGQSGAGGAIRDAGLGTSGPKDAAPTCPTTCPGGKQCFSGQCCATPAAGGVCTHFPSCGCPTGNICYPSSTAHAMACYSSDDLPGGADCTGSTCKAGFGCFGGICKAYCNTQSDCAPIRGHASCDQATWSSDSTDIAGVMVCERICDPAHPQAPIAPLLACPSGFNCISDTAGISYCIKASPTGSTCSAEKDCPAGYYCSSSSTCKRYCLSDGDCPSGNTCRFTFDPPEYASDIPVGYCGVP